MSKTAKTSTALCAGTAVLLAVPAWSDWNDYRSSSRMTTLPSLYREVAYPDETLFASCSVLNHGKNITAAVKALSINYSSPGWDGYGAKPASELSIQYALRFVSRLRSTIEEPDVGIDADGEVTLEWYHNRDNRCILTFGTNGTIYCNQRVAGYRIAVQCNSLDTDRVIGFVYEVAGNA